MNKHVRIIDAHVNLHINNVLPMGEHAGVIKEVRRLVGKDGVSKKVWIPKQSEGGTQLWCHRFPLSCLSEEAQQIVIARSYRGE